MAREEKKTEDLALMSGRLPIYTGIWVIMSYNSDRATSSYEAIRAQEEGHTAEVWGQLETANKKHSILNLVFWIIIFFTFVSTVAFTALTGIWYLNQTPCANVSDEKTSNISPIVYATTIGLGITSLISWLQYPVYLYGLWMFLKRHPFSCNGMKRGLKNWITRNKLNAAAKVVFFVLTISTACGMLIMVTALGIRIETVLDETLFSCGSHNINIYYAYILLGISLRVFSLLIVILMACATLAVAEIWTSHSEDLASPPTSSEPQFTLTTAMMTAYDHHATLSIQYKETGEMVKSIKKMFQNYFPLPWIAFFILTAVESQIKVFSGEQDQRGVTADVVNQRIAYVVLFCIFYIIHLFTLFVFAVSMNQNHTHFLKAMREKQLEYDIEKKETPDMEETEYTFLKACHGYACILQIERDEDYDFVPRIVFLGINVRVNDSTYVIVLLIGGLFGVASSLI